MEPTLNQASIILAASDHEPDIVTKEWLEQNSILKEEPIEFVYRQGRLFVETENYSINLVEQQLKIAAKNSNTEVLNNLQIIANQYIETLPKLSYNAVGLNYNWQVLSTDADLLKKIFVANPKKFDKAIPDKTYGIGGFIYYEYQAFNVFLMVISEPDDHIAADFNYHSDITDSQQLSQKISQFTDIKENARDTITKLLGN